MAMTLPLDTIDDSASPHPDTTDTQVDTNSPPPTNTPSATTTGTTATTTTTTTATDTQPAQAKRKPSRRANTAERRATHNAVERQRRETLNGRFLDLAALLPNLSQIRRPSKSSIVNSSIAHIHASRRHRILAARELRQVKLEADSLRREINEWRDRAGISRLEEPPRSEAFSMILSGELEVLNVPQSDAMDDEDGDDDLVGVQASYPIIHDDLSLDDDALVPHHPVAAHHPHHAPAPAPAHHQMFQAAPAQQQQHSLDLDDPRFAAILKHHQQQSQGGGPFAHSVPAPAPAPRQMHFDYQQYVPPHAQWEAAAAAAAAQRSLFTPPTSSHGMPTSNNHPSSPNGSTTNTTTNKMNTTTKNGPGSPATAPSPHDSVHSGSGHGGSPSPPLPHLHHHHHQPQHHGYPHHAHPHSHHAQMLQQQQHGQQHMTLSINTAAAIAAAAASRPSPPSSSAGGTPPNTAISPASPRERAYELHQAHQAAVAAGHYGNVPRFAGGYPTPTSAGVPGMHHSGMVGMSNGMMMMM